jgi:hypothetical protein
VKRPAPPAVSSRDGGCAVSKVTSPLEGLPFGRQLQRLKALEVGASGVRSPRRSWLQF